MGKKYPPIIISIIDKIEEMGFQVIVGFNGEKRLLFPKNKFEKETETSDFIIYKLK